jgi:hypothetical protein
MKPWIQKCCTLLLVALVAVPSVPAFGNDEETDEETTTSSSASSRRKLAGAEDGSEADEEVSAQNGGDEATTASNGDEEEEKDARAEKLFKRLKGFVKALDARSTAYPNPLFESAIRNEFLRQAEGKRDLGWLRGKSLDSADRNVAQDNFELFLSYAEKLGAAKKGAKDADLLAVKSLIDRYAKSGMTANDPPEGLGKVGRAELKRQYLLLGKLVSGPGYEPLKFTKLEDAGKAYRARLLLARSEFEKLAKSLGGSKKVVKRSEPASNDRKPASTKGKKVGKADKSNAKKKKK